jgi:hypothetical protein
MGMQELDNRVNEDRVKPLPTTGPAQISAAGTSVVAGARGKVGIAVHVAQSDHRTPHRWQ